MAIYEYVCMACLTDVERRSKIEDRNNTPECPECGRKMFRKWTFKGATWAPTSTGSDHK